MRAPPQRRGFLHEGRQGPLIISGVHRRDKMQLTGGIKMTKRHWLVLDLLAILLVAGTVTGIVAIWTGAWWPFETLQLPQWPHLAFFAWFLATSTALAVFGSHLQWSNMQHSAAAVHETKPAEARLTPAEPALIANERSHLCLDLSEHALEFDHSDEGETTVEPVLVSAGR
jgi:hypothetical protein